ncbi:MAG: tetratricopeptide repeat protein [Planctomycetota bacterium]|jgi:predicted Zn-dependent protease
MKPKATLPHKHLPLLLAALPLVLFILGCEPSHDYVDRMKMKAEKSQSGMQAMNLYGQAKQAYLSGNLKLALGHINDSIASKGDVADSQVLRLQILIDMNRNADVLPAAKAGERVAPDDARFPYYLGIYYERNDKPKMALEGYKEAAKRDPGEIQYKLAAAQIMIEERQFRDAERHLKRTLKVHPNSPEVLQTLGALAQIQGSTKRAALYFREALALAPNERSLKENMAKIHFAMGEHFKALHHLEALLKQPGMEDRNDLNNLAIQCYLKCNRPVEARRLLQRLAASPEKANYTQLRQMADAAVLLSDWHLLKSAGTQMVTLQPKALPGYLALALCQEKEGNASAAWLTLEEYRALCEGSVPSLVTRYQKALK